MTTFTADEIKNAYRLHRSNYGTPREKPVYGNHGAIVDWKTAQDAQWEIAALREENKKLRRGAELGPIIGMEVIASQKQKLDHLAAKVAALLRIAETAQPLLEIAKYIVPLSESEEVFELEEALKDLPK